MDEAFVYMNEESINSELICNICQKPFSDPCCTSCDQIFCRKCITRWIQRTNGSCPHCRQTLLIDTLRLVPRSLQSRLDRLHVMCIVCGQTELERGNLDEHSQQVCPRTIISCPLIYAKCMWKGQRDQLSQHIADCHAESVALVINGLLIENKIFEHQVSQETIQITEQQIEIRQLKEKVNQQIIQIDGQHNENQHLKDQEKQQTIEKVRQKNVIEDLIEVLSQQKTQIEDQQNESQQLEEQAKMLIMYLSQKLDGQLTQSDIEIISMNNQSIPPLRSSSIDIHPNAKWSENGLTVAGGNGQGNEINRLYSPLGLYVHDDQTIYVADYDKHCIMEWKHGAKIGKVVVGGNGTHQLNYPVDVIVEKQKDSLIISDRGNYRVVRWPRQYGTSGEIIISNISCWGLTMDENGSFYVVDEEKAEVRRYRSGDVEGTVVAGGNGHGNRLDQFNHPRYVFIDRDYSIYVSDLRNHRVMKWIEGAKQGIIVAGGQGQGNSFKQLSEPKGVIVDQLGSVYVADCSNHRIMCWPKGGKQGSIIAGRNGKGEQSNQLSSPVGLSFDRYGNLYVVDNNNHRVQQFQIKQTISS